MRSGKCMRSESIRKQVNLLIIQAGPGAIVHTHKIAQSINQYSGVSNTSIGLALRERDDVELIKSGVWKVLSSPK